MEADWWARGISGFSVVVACTSLWLAYFRGRTIITTYIGTVEEGGFLKITNHSAHPVTIEDVGLIDGDGSLQDWWGKGDSSFALPSKVDTRSSVVFHMHDDYRLYTAYQRSTYERVGCYAIISGGKMFADTGRMKRLAWRLMSKCKKLYGA